MAGLFGVMHAGATVVPTFPPSGKRAAERLAAVLRGCSPQAVMVDRGRTPERMPADPPVLEISGAATGEEFGCIPADPGLLQYTSGSTADPKGIMLNHANLMSNCAALTAHIGHESDRVGLTWLPPYHDMGLIGTLLFALHGGWPLVMMDPEHFVQTPARWLRAVGEFGVTITVAPAFALQLCTESISDEELAEIDLSGLRQLFCGSEPIHPDVLGRFVMRFESRGLSSTALIPCYGLAEATLFVAGKRADEQVRVDRGVVSCGVPAAGHEVFIVDPESGKPCPDGQVGEIQVRGPNVAAGYFHDSEATGVTFRAGPHRDALRTGDLGYLRDGELFVTGRISGLIVIAGRNLHPQDVEATANTCHAAVFHSVAFSVPGASGEELVVVAERRVTTGLTEVRAAITAAVTAAHGVRPRDVEFVGIGRIPRTTSGKLRRAEARRRYLAAAG
ncbi:acyl-CoA synthetase (AMP-forming)/AMP-acid ligase II [Kibdelosporangium banguiense]|uniref:Acyl-CoA synthetase (AMP-forming)/AMP-acid ligase II n=1 Tax=Kibdelosporangium banguiense TaxID=1365924 RepID=A0ABS4TCP5_9PSEU|nr:acyl-CoA synthetase (AMP-forming)/AMP-acid ligase II [Kibdelosporangium banguiense]